MCDFDLYGKVAVIIGASSGLAVSKELHTMGNAPGVKCPPRKIPSKSCQPVKSRGPVW
jgi:hypothetical protein